MTEKFSTASELLEAARVARVQMCVFRHDAQSPGETASLSRMLWYSIPEFVKRTGVALNQDEGYPPNISSTDEAIVNRMTIDMQGARSVAEWLGPLVMSEQSKSLFSKGKDNSMFDLIEEFAAKRGFVRTDALAIEANSSYANNARMMAISATNGREVG